VSAADKVKEVKRVFITRESVAKMNQLDRTAMEQATALQHPAKRKNGVLARTAADGREASCMRQARRKSQGSAHCLTHIA
jgi:hypothetical protein